MSELVRRNGVHASARARVVAFVSERSLLGMGQKVLVATGGGARSLGLMALLSEAQAEIGLARVAVASVEPDLDDESDAAEIIADVGRLARTLGLDFYAVRPAPSRGGKVDVLAELLGLARTEGFDRVALGDTRDDDAVRVLCELARGGAEAVRGLAPRVRGGAVRPLLVLADAEAMAFVPPEAAGWGPGASKASKEEQAVRRDVLPRLRVLFPDVDAALQGLGRLGRARRRASVERGRSGR